MRLTPGAVRTAAPSRRDRADSRAIRTTVIGEPGPPLLLLFDCLPSNIRPAKPGRRWLLVTPSGACAIVWAGTNCNSVRTYYFTGAVSVEPRNNRWREAVRQHVQEYAKYDPFTKKYILPPGDHRVEIGVAEELRYHMRFLTPNSWGFQGDAINSPWGNLPVGVWLVGDGGQGGAVASSPKVTAAAGDKVEGTSDA